MDALTMAFTASNIFGKAHTGNIGSSVPIDFRQWISLSRNDFHDSSLVYKGGKWGVSQLSEASSEENVFGKNQ